MRRTPGGYEIRFMSLLAVQRRDIRRMMKVIIERYGEGKLTR